MSILYSVIVTKGIKTNERLHKVTGKAFLGHLLSEKLTHRTLDFHRDSTSLLLFMPELASGELGVAFGKHLDSALTIGLTHGKSYQGSSHFGFTASLVLIFNIC